MSYARHQNPSFRSKKLILRERLPKPRAYPQVPRAAVPVFPSRLRGLSGSRVPRYHVCLRRNDMKTSWCSSCTSIVRDVRWFFAFPIKAHVFSFLLSCFIQGEPGFLCDATQPTAPSRDASLAWSFSQGSASKFVCNRRGGPCDKWKLVKQSPFIRHSGWRQSGGCRVGCAEAGECFAPQSEGECPPSKEARACLGIWRKSLWASARDTSMGEDSTCT